jgi:ABC-type phosphate/phosphonate transport system permease subunit
MAHKNWSKEQYKFQYFKFLLKFNFFLSEKNTLNNLNSTLIFLFLTKKTFPNLETNILFLKNIQFFFFFKDKDFFNYNFKLK